MKKRIWLSVLAAAVVIAGGISWLASRHYVVPIMMYHHVNNVDPKRQDTVSPERFEWHMAYLKKHHFRVLSLSTLVQIIKQGKPLPRKSVVITFDDGYADNYQYAFPILKKYGFPAAIFVITDVISAGEFLTTAQMKEMLAQGIEIGSHTRRHAYLPGILGKTLLEEIQGSKDRLEQELGVAITNFAYPNGGFNEDAKRIVQQAGYESACTTNRGYDRFNRDVYELKRVRFSDQDDRVDYLWMKLSGYYNLFRKAKSPY
ncbi:MAG: polysaccharide deacetylase family protein [Candidatus Omnitrophica bacterium]|nr:polysaccharide deacetylase family protein [Candidatus Omnitrophota bacterium]MBI5024615.1 polysaccharide deacetylase family protein [Candidatus Omnitrophota bacterium]